MSEHTKGPWTVATFGNSTTVEAPSRTVCVKVSNCDADLISAAPDLLEALEASLICLEWWRTRYPIDASGKEARVIANAQAALKKAKP